MPHAVSQFDAISGMSSGQDVQLFLFALCSVFRYSMSHLAFGDVHMKEMSLPEPEMNYASTKHDDRHVFVFNGDKSSFIQRK